MLPGPSGWGSGLIAGLLLWALAGQARAEEVALNWVRLDGAEACIDAPRLAKVVETRIGRAVLQSPARADASIEAHVGPEPNGGYHAVIALHARNGTLIGQRELKVAAGDCSELDQPASLIISLMIDPNAAGPGVMEHGILSPAAQRLVAQLDLPSGDPDTLLAALDFSTKPRERSALTDSGTAEPAPAHADETKIVPRAPVQQQPASKKMVSVSEAEWQKLQALRREHLTSSGAHSPKPHWPGYALLGLAGAAAAGATYAQIRLNTLNNDPALVAYRSEVPVVSRDTCDAVRADQPLGTRYDVFKPAYEICRETLFMSILFWASAVSTVASAATGAAWLIWIADDDEPEAKQEQKASISLRPYLLGAELRIQL